MSGMFAKIDFEQPATFEFSSENLQKAKQIIARYPSGKERSAVMPLLWLAQNQNSGWIPTAAMNLIAEMLSMHPMQVYEVANFYTMYNKQPIGKYLIQVCRTTPCWLCGSDAITLAIRKHLGVEVGHTTSDGLFTLVEVECLGACVKAPVVQINDTYYENLSEESIVTLLKSLQ